MTERTFTTPSGVEIAYEERGGMKMFTKQGLNTGTVS